MPCDFNDDDVLHLLELVLAEPDPTLARLCVQVADYLGVPVASVANRVELPPRATKASAVKIAAREERKTRVPHVGPVNRSSEHRERQWTSRSDP